MYFEHKKKYSFVKIIGYGNGKFFSTLNFVPTLHFPMRVEIVELTSTDETLVPRVGQLDKTTPGFVFQDAEGGEWFHTHFADAAGTINAAAVRNHVNVKHKDSDSIGMIFLVEIEAYLKHIKASAYPGINDTTVENNLREFHSQLLTLANKSVS